MAPTIQPRTLRGFRDYQPSTMLAREHLIDTARAVYRSYGFAPIDTPALEYTEILLGKGGDETDKQMFRFEDQGGRDVAMRFDLTIPFARFAAQYAQNLGTPFKRYHVGTVWRGESPQKGRYREFIQCDFDTIGTVSNTADIETLLVIHDLILKLGIEKFSIRVNNRQVLNGLLEAGDLLDRSTGVLRALDKLPKIGRDAVLEELREKVEVPAESAEALLQSVELEGSPEEILGKLAKLVGENETGQRGIACLEELFTACRQLGLPEDRVRLDPSIARGLDYYTGTIYETFLDELPTIGSVCSGGRYDDLAGLFTKQKLPGVGASLGVDRLLAALEELGLVEERQTPCPVLITCLDAGHRLDYLSLARELRSAGIDVEVYPEPKAIGKQFKYADRKGFQLVVIAGSDEFADGKWQVKSLAEGKQSEVPATELVDWMKQQLSPIA
ncbi:histidine--tRNA ligase [Calycomorphotria hydatis]|uniref:Histidine--tRNA ligase n=1 Tax=Calycomorphotria hydatis TaxID=2528027 RepID=A0A517T789_9PLAN|nr:histidine--tRNA ligase [Calycomorphotria hydatis]QDT64220.1 Histidine--tRNA ligase [Calycomorphotria hydatis]